MQEATVSVLPTWQNFYVIIGSSAAALTGLMFVVITLIAGTREARASEALAAFSTPNVVHFPPTPDVPPMLQGKAVVMVLGCYHGSEADGEAVFQPMRTLGMPLLDTFARIPYSERPRKPPSFQTGDERAYLLGCDGLGTCSCRATICKANRTAAVSETQA